jgi:ATP-dependent helicase HrpB
MASLQAKLEVLRTAIPEVSIPALDEAAVRQLVSQACEGLVSLAELKAAPVIDRILASLDSNVAGLLRRETPDFVTLPGGRRVSIQYEAGKPPWIESRLQDFFGMGAGPVIGRGRVPLTLHLLAPNKRAVQVTSDLAGFWKRHYPEIRRELGRRYPRHPWPEDGATAQPPEPRPPRRS